MRRTSTLFSLPDGYTGNSPRLAVCAGRIARDLINRVSVFGVDARSYYRATLPCASEDDADEGCYSQYENRCEGKNPNYPKLLSIIIVALLVAE
jgi:hypothetical protein